MKANEASENGFVPTAETKEMMESMGRFIDELIKAGITKDGDCYALTPSSQDKRISCDSPQLLTSLFPQPRDHVTDYWLWEVKYMNEVVACVMRCHKPRPGQSQIEIRPLCEMYDICDKSTHRIESPHFGVADILLSDVLRLVDRLDGLVDYPAYLAYVGPATARPAAFKKAHADQMEHFTSAD